MPWLFSLLFLATPSVNVSANRLETGLDGWRAQGAVKVDGDGWTLTANRAESRFTPQCPEGQLVLRGSVEFRRENWQAGAETLEGCLARTRWTAQSVQLVAPRLVLTAKQARVQGDTLEAADLVTTRCGCENPPWRITAAGGRITLGEGAWLRWPVLWLGPVPVATFPRWYVPTKRRQTGFLAPRFGYHGEGGWTGRLPFFLVLGQSADLTLSPGWRQTDGFAGDLGLRWTTAEADEGHLEVQSFAEGTRVWGRGTSAWGPARLGLDGDFVTTSTAREALGDTLDVRRQTQGWSLAGLAFANGDVGLGGRIVVPSPDGRGSDSSLFPTFWMRMTHPYESGRVTLDLSATQVRENEGEIRDVLRIGTSAQSVNWVGPLRLRWDGGILSHTANGAPTHPALGQLSVFSVLDFRLEAARPGRLAHHVSLTARPRWAGWSGDSTATEPLTTVSSAGLVLELDNRWVGSTWTGAVTFRVPYEARAPIEGWAPGVAELTLESETVGLTANGTTRGDVWARGDVKLAQFTLRGTYFRRTTQSTTSPWRRHWSEYGPLVLNTTDGPTQTGRLGVSLPLRRVRLGYDTVVAMDPFEALEHHGRITYTAACNCLSVSVNARQHVNRRFPDVFLSVGL